MGVGSVEIRCGVADCEASIRRVLRERGRAGGDGRGLGRLLHAVAAARRRAAAARRRRAQRRRRRRVRAAHRPRSVAPLSHSAHIPNRSFDPILTKIYFRSF